MKLGFRLETWIETYRSWESYAQRPEEEIRVRNEDLQGKGWIRAGEESLVVIFAKP